MSHQTTTLMTVPCDPEPLHHQLATANLKTQLSLINDLIAQGDEGLTCLQNYLLDTEDLDPTPARGKIYQALTAAENGAFGSLIQATYPQGIVTPAPDCRLDYQPLQDALIAQDFLQADRLCVQALCALVGPTAVQRKWLYFSEVDKIPVVDFQTINTLWLTYSEGKFGFSVQRELWLGAGKNFTKLWDKMGWKSENNWTRYPQGFTWDLSAPRGHLPLSNQLRGVRTFEAILNHPAWQT